MCHPSLTALSGSHHRAVTSCMRGVCRMMPTSFCRRGRRAVKLQYNFIFPSWRILFGPVKREVQIRSEGWVASRSAEQTPFCAQLIFCCEEWSDSTVFIISLWGELTVTLWCQCCSWLACRDTEALSQWIMKQRLCEWIFSCFFIAHAGRIDVDSRLVKRVV